MIKKISCFLLLTVGIFGFADFALADLEAQCAAISESANGCQGMSDDACKALLQQCSDYYDEQSTKISEDITKTAAQKSTLQGEISTLKKRIQNLDTQISQSNVKVKSLNLQITDTQSSINQATEDIDSSEVQIASILRAIHEQDQTPAFVVLLNGSLSDFFSNITYLENLDSKVGDLLDSTKDLQNYLQGQKTKMDGEVDQLQKTITIQQLQKQENDKNKKTQEQYLSMTEAQYQQQLKEKQDIDKKATEIKNRIFQLSGVADTDAPSFGEAVEIAKYVQGVTGVRPAFLLALLQQETGIGKNVGQCYLKDTTTGSGTNIKTGAVIKNVMKPMGLAGRKGDIDDFLIIIQELGKDAFTTTVSCPQPSVGGYGGAMGPAQFIPTTWSGLRQRLEKILGRPANPWNIRDAFLGSGLYLSDLGATKNTKCSNGKSSEWGAALGYFSGTICSTNSKYAFYGNSVIAIAAQFEEDITTIGE
jgi:peptidoglycan hydrolase CwlO-like protein